MFDWLRPKIYVRLTPSWLSVRNVTTNKAISGIPYLAMRAGDDKKVLAVGDDVAFHMHNTGVLVINPFTHPRSLISDITAAEVVLKGFVRRVQARGHWLQSRPVIIMHPVVEPDGGFTQVEVRALMALGLSVGSVVKLWRGPELSDQNLRASRYPTDGKLLT